jgi:soluble lytic murein transglycosylase-like protein
MNWSLRQAFCRALLVGAALIALSVPVIGAEKTTATLPAANSDILRPPLTELRLPEIIPPEDALRYGEIFRLQEKGAWTAADRRIRKLNDRLLMGHVLAQRYLHPTHYRSRFSELSTWLTHYADHPDARRIYYLAIRRKPKNAKAPRSPKRRFTVSSANIDPRQSRNTHRVRRGERAALRHVSRLVLRERLSEAARYLNQASVIKRIGRTGVDRAQARIAAGWFRRGKPDRAYTLAAAAARRSGMRAPGALWWAGLSAFQLGQYDDAIHHFENLSQTANLTGRDQARALFWAGRAAFKAGQVRRVGSFFDRAAKFDRTFYGQIAARIRADGPRFDWTPPKVTNDDIAGFAKLKAGRRTLALIQVGEEGRAETELRTLRLGAPPHLLRTVIAMGDAADMPGTSLRASRVLLRAKGERIDAGLYPIPHWVPENGFQIDRALVYGFARQESGFNVRARSRAGARGLLQLMPATARYMAASRRSFRGRNRAQLFNPGLNLRLGQKYLDYLLSGEAVSGNLVLMIAAYNGGPGNLAKWQRQVSHGSDPLVFIETIPVRETRLFVQRVLENVWIYRARLGQEAPSLEALAGGRWPNYVSLDGARYGVAEERP